MIQRPLGKAGPGNGQLLESASEQCVSLGRADAPAQGGADKAHQHHIWLQVLNASQGTEVLPGDPSQAVNAGPGTPNYPIIRALAEVIYLGHRLGLQSTGNCDAQVRLQDPSAARVTPAEELAYKVLADQGPGSQQKLVQAMLAEPRVPAALTATASTVATTCSTSKSTTSLSRSRGLVRARPWKASGCTDRATDTQAVRYASVDSPPVPATARRPRPTPNARTAKQYRRRR